MYFANNRSDRNEGSGIKEYYVILSLLANQNSIFTKN